MKKNLQKDAIKAEVYANPEKLLAFLGYDIKIRKETSTEIRYGSSGKLRFSKKTGYFQDFSIETQAHDCFSFFNLIQRTSFIQSIQELSNLYNLGNDPDPKNLITQPPREQKKKYKEEEEKKKIFFNTKLKQFNQHHKKSKLDDPYLQDKNLSNQEVTHLFKKIIIPYYNKEEEITALQTITKEEKKFIWGSKVQGCYAPSSDRAINDIIVLTEGWANALAIEAALSNIKAFASGSLGNLQPAYNTLREIYPNKTLIIAADFDGSKKQNIGLLKALELFTIANEANHNTLLWSPIEDLKSSLKYDFADLWVLGGEKSIKTSFDRMIQAHTISSLEESPLEERLKKARSLIAQETQKAVQLDQGLIVKATTGIGKTYTMCSVLEDNPEKYFVCAFQSYDLLNEAYKAICARGLKDQVKISYGRTNPDNRGKSNKDFDCFRISDVKRASEKNHIPQSSICFQCQHYYKGVLDQGIQENDSEKKILAFKQAKSMNIPTNLPSCSYLFKGLAQAKEARIIFCLQQSLSKELLKTKEGKQRFLILDEEPKRIKTITYSLDQLNTLMKQSKSEEPFHKFFKSVAKDLIEGEILEETKIQAKQLLRDYAHKETLTFERVCTNSTYVDIPFKGTIALIKALTGTDNYIKILHDQTLTVAYPSFIGDFLCKNSAFMLLSASINESTIKTILKENSNCSLLEISIAQPIEVTFYEGTLHGRGSIRQNGYERKLERNKKTAENAVKDLLEKYNRGVAILSHSNFIKDNILLKIKGVISGYFGNHDKGVNTFAGRNLVIQGSHFFREDELITQWTQYNLDRKLQGKSLLPFPTRDPSYNYFWTQDKEAQEWLVSLYLDVYLQQIGRARALNKKSSEDPFQIFILGGVLQQHAIQKRLEEVLGCFITIKRNLFYKNTFKKRINLQARTFQALNKLRADKNFYQLSQSELRRRIKHLSGVVGDTSSVNELIKIYRHQYRPTKTTPYKKDQYCSKGPKIALIETTRVIPQFYQLN